MSTFDATGTTAPDPVTRGPEPQHTTPRRSKPIAGGIAAALALAVGAAAAGAASGYLVTAHSTAPSAATTGTGTAGTAATGTAATQATGVADTTSLADLIANVKAEVVSIAVQSATTADQGSGIVVRSDGTILTNNHVISAAAGGGTITVTFSDGKTAAATVVTADPNKDLALIKTSTGSTLTVASFGNSSSLQLGDSVIAIGNELGLPGSVSEGIVSGLNRTLTAGDEAASSSSDTTTYTDAIQTDAATNPGDSGGPLFNTAGQVIGVNTAIASASSRSSGSIGVGFAIPSNDVAAFVNRAVNET